MSLNKEVRANRSCESSASLNPYNSRNRRKQRLRIEKNIHETTSERKNLSFKTWCFNFNVSGRDPFDAGMLVSLRIAEGRSYYGMLQDRRK